jgi:acetate kinase
MTRPSASRAVLTLNAGSSSLKVALFPVDGDAPLERPLATGLADRIGPEGTLKLTDTDGTLLPATGDLTTHAGAIAAVIAGFRSRWPDLGLSAIGHRVVHGGPDRHAPAVVTGALLADLDRLSPFAPLHQPHNLAGIRAAMAAFPGVPQVACFDTAFHRGHPFVNDTFALPRALYDEGVRRYGFHGLSYQFIAGDLARTEPRLAQGRVVVAHLGNGASMCAMQAGRSIASTMGFSPLDGLPMGTRPGQLDPGVLLYLMDQKGMKAAEISDLLYRQSGLLGLSGLSNDMRALDAAGTPEAEEAIAYFVARCQREVAGMAAAIGGIDALVFCGGIGENAKTIRARICDGLGWMGIDIDPARNAANARVISPDAASTAVMVIPTNEELVIARAAISATTAT